MELMVTVGLFSVLMTLLVMVFNKGSRAVLAANSRQQAEISLNKAHFWLKRDLEQADATQLRRKRVSLPGNGDAIWFLSAEDPSELDPDRRFRQSSETGAPRFQSQILYYLVRPVNYTKISGGLAAGIDPDPNSDFFAPHKFLVRKVINMPGDPEVLLSESEIDDYITPPLDYTLSPFSSEDHVVESKLVSDKLLSFEALAVQSVLEVKTSSLRIDEARKSVSIGTVSLKENPLVVHRTTRYELRN